MGRYGGTAAVPWPEARLTAHAAGVPLPPESRPLDACAGTALAGPLVARTALPAFATAAMDGWAVAGDGPWRLVGDVRAGTTGQPLSPGTAVLIATGAPVPAGARAVLPVERGSFLAGLVTGEVADGRHVRAAGEECAAGEELLPAGAAVTAAVLGLAAASGHDALLVHPRPRVAALVTGDELLSEGLPGDGRVRDALGPQLRVLVEGAGGLLASSQRVRDDRGLLRAALLGADGDVVLTTGASSVGAADHLRPLLVELGAEVLVDGVACRPGHPQLLARLPDGRPLVGLPGNPLAALVAAATLLSPLLAGLGGGALPVLRRAVLATGVRAAPDGTRLLPVRVEGRTATQVRHTGAGMLRGAALADALAVVPPGDGLAAGDEVELVELA